MSVEKCYLKWKDVIEEFDKAYSMSITPDIPLYSADHIFDENQSVKWNREKAAEMRGLYYQQKDILSKKRREAENKACDGAIYLIQEETGLLERSARRIWSYAWEKGHANGIRDIISELHEVTSLICDIKDEIVFPTKTK